MRERFERAWPTRKRIRILPIIAIVVAVLALGAAAIWYIRSAGGPTEGSLRVNINTATLTELESIPGIGPARAKQIVARRPYKSVDELIDISGIGPKSLESLRPFVKVEGEAEKLL
jgi:competence ComEA-like helix-hairpin-helix protein